VTIAGEATEGVTAMPAVAEGEAPGAVATIGYEELVRRIQHGNRQARVPLQGSFELTYRCNVACTHCWVNLPTGDRGARARELSTDEACRIVDEIAEAGGFWLLLTGGEVFVRPDFFEIYRHVKRRGLLPIVYTNGTMITEKVADQLAEFPPARVEISLYGVTRQTYRAVTGHDGLDRCLRGIRLLLDRGLNLKLKSVVTTANYDEFVAIRDFVRREFGLGFTYDPNINFRKVEGRAGSAPAAVRVAPEKIVALDQVMEAETGELREFYARDQRLESDYVFTCGAGLNTYHIDPYGAMSSCMMVPSIAYDLRQGSFREGWRSFGERVVSLKRSRDTRCTSCAIAGACDSCPGWSTLEHGTLESPVDYMCEINHRRAEAFGGPDLIKTIAMKRGMTHG
jgi:radical SAM protein with 4Fe4S-binding SPASM domain